jgi:hypothetical protein
MKRAKIISGISALFFVAVPVFMFVSRSSASEAPSQKSQDWRTPWADRIVVNYATNALRYLASARQNIAQNNIGGAQSELGRALTVIDRMKSRFLAIRLQDLAVGARIRLTYQNPNEALAYLRLIAPSFNDLPQAGSLKKDVQATLARAETALRNNNKNAADRELAAVTDALAYDSPARPLSLAEKHMFAAASELEKQQGPTADREIAAAENDLNVIAFGAYMPFSETQKSLGQAALDNAAARATDAKASLERASRALAYTLKDAGLKGRAELENLDQDIRALIATSAQSGEKLGSSIHQLWQRGESLTERALDYETAAWVKFQSSKADAGDLIEAKLHVDFAEIYEFTTGDTKKAAAELNQAQAYLQKASPLLSAREKSTVNAVNQDLGRWRLSLARISRNNAFGTKKSRITCPY